MEVEYKTKYNSSYNLKNENQHICFFSQTTTKTMVHEEQNCVICVKF